MKKWLGKPKPALQKFKQENGAYIAITCPRCGEPIESTPATLKSKQSDCCNFECKDFCPSCGWSQLRSWAERGISEKEIWVKEWLENADKDFRTRTESTKPTICVECKKHMKNKNHDLCVVSVPDYINGGKKTLGLPCHKKNHGNCGDFEAKVKE